MSDVAIVSADGSTVVRIGTDVFAPAAFDLLFLRPRHPVDSPAALHLPLLFWTCASLRPRDAAVIGAGDGTVHFALCQAIERLAVQGRCTGYGFWDRPRHEGAGRSIPDPLQRHQQMFYEDISRLASVSDLDDLAGAMAPVSLDLLWLDVAAAPEGLAQRTELLQRALRPGGVMFLHGTSGLAEGGPDSMLLQRLTAGRQHVRFDDGQGLLMLPGEHAMPPRIATLVAAAEGGRLPPDVERVFRRIGQGLLASARLADAAAARADAESRAAGADTARHAAESALQNLTSAYDLRNRTLAEVQSALFDARMMVADLQARISSIEAERSRERRDHSEAIAEFRGQLDGLNARLSDSENARVALSAAHEAAERQSHARIEALSAEVESLRDRLSTTEREAKDEREAHFSETAALARISEELRSQLTEATARNQELTAAHEAAERQSHARIEALSAEAESLRDRLSATEREAKAAAQAARDEREARFTETAALARISEELRSQLSEATSRIRELTASLQSAQRQARDTETKLKAEIAEERRLRFRETATLTRMLEELRSQASRKRRRVEEWLVRRVVGNDRKLRKYRRDRVAFFADSRSMLARAYFRLRPGP